MKYAVATALLVLAAMTGCSYGMPDGVIYPAITPDGSVSEDIPVTASFNFEGEPVTISVTVDGSLYQGAVDAEKSVTRFGNAREEDWIEDYFPAFAEEPHLEPFYRALIAEFRRVRDERGLDDDQYAELMTVYAQSIEYHTDPVDLEPKFPVETFVEGKGDCDDKTLLLAGLLAHEGYDVAVLLFEPERHVALGIRSDELAYPGTGYAYTETTSQGFIGMVPEHFAGGLELESEPQVFAIGSGTRRYTAGAQVNAILTSQDRAAGEAHNLNEQVADADAELREIEYLQAEQRDRMDAARYSGDMDGYGQLVAEYDDLARRYAAASAERDALVERRDRLLQVDRLVAEGFDDRTGTFYAVQAADD